MDSPNFLNTVFGLTGKTAIVTGGTGVLGSAMCLGLARAGARVAILGRRAERAIELTQQIEREGGEAMPLVADVMDRAQLESARDRVIGAWGKLDILVNGAGGNAPSATVPVGGEFFSLTQDGMQGIIDLNLMGTILPSQIFGQVMAQQKAGCIVNISSLSVPRALSRVIAYGAAKAGIENFTRWLAVEFANKYGEGMRVNAIAPGFFLADMNRGFFVNPDGSWTPRAQAVLAHTPAKRFGQPDELVGALIWLCSPSAAFVNGAVIAVDGAFGATSGV